MKNNALDRAWYSWIIAVGFLSLGVGSAKAQLASHIGVATSPPVWSYTLFNDEPASSTDFIDIFTLAVNATVTITGTPAGWESQTDNTSYVEWDSTGDAYDIAPGASLGGFIISSTQTHSDTLAYVLQSFDHSDENLGTSSAGTVLAPSAAAPAPEPSSLTAWGLGALAVGLLAVCRRRRTAHGTWRHADQGSPVAGA